VAKRKPDQTINLRLELQDYERKALSTALTASAIKDMADAFDKLTSFENMYVIATVLELTTGKEILPGTPNDLFFILDALRDWSKTQEEEGPWWHEVLKNLPTAYGGLFD